MTDVIQADPVIENAVSRLLSAHSTGTPVDLPADLTDTQAMAVQLAVAKRRGGIAAWKIGLVGGIVHAAPIARDAVHASGHAYAAGQFSMRGLEAEVAFQLRRSIDARGSAGDPLDAIGDARHAVEVLDSRLRDWRQAPLAQIRADGLNNGGLILGRAIENWRDTDLRAPGVDLFVDDALRGAANHNPAGDPRTLVAHLIAHCRDNGISLPRGTWITTGSSTGCVFVDPGTAITVREGRHTLVSLTFD